LKPIHEEIKEDIGAVQLYKFPISSSGTQTFEAYVYYKGKEFGVAHTFSVLERERLTGYLNQTARVNLINCLRSAIREHIKPEMLLEVSMRNAHLRALAGLGWPIEGDWAYRDGLGAVLRLQCKRCLQGTAEIAKFPEEFDAAQDRIVVRCVCRGLVSAFMHDSEELQTLIGIELLAG
jgi:hypothetical protein